MSEWILKVERVSDGYRGAELDGEIEIADESKPLPRHGDWFKLVPLSKDEALEALGKKHF